MFLVEKVRRARKYCVFGFRAVLKDMSTTPGRIWVPSLNATRVTSVLDALTQTDMATADPRLALLEAACTADEVNRAIAEGEAPITECDCDETTAPVTVHHCAMCTHELLCSTMSCNEDGLNLQGMQCKICTKQNTSH